jgi:hypothetical protein
MSITELLPEGQVSGWAITTLILFLSLIQISPLKLNPWDRVLGWVGKKLNGAQLAALQKQINTLWINNHRQTLLTFARECRSDIYHSPEEWAHVLNVAEEYEQYCVKHEVSNGVVKQDTKYIRGLYQDMSRNHQL